MDKLSLYFLLSCAAQSNHFLTLVRCHLLATHRIYMTLILCLSVLTCMIRTDSIFPKKRLCKLNEIIHIKPGGLVLGTQSVLSEGCCDHTSQFIEQCHEFQ